MNVSPPRAIRWIAPAIVIGMSALCGGAFAQAQHPAAEERRVQAELIRRMRAFVEYLRAEAHLAGVAASTVRVARPTAATEVFATAGRQRSALAQDIAKRVPAPSPGGGVSIAPAAQQDAVAQELTAGAQRISRYADDVERLTVGLAGANSSEILRALEEIRVPREVTVAASGVEPWRSPDAPSAAAAGAPRGGLRPFIVGPGSSATVDYPAVAAVVANDTSRGNLTVCTGTLVAPRVVLTAAHCLRYRLVGVFFQHAGFFELQGPPVPHPAFRFPDSDLAVLILKRPVEGIMPAPLNDSSPVATGTLSRIVGFGYRNGLAADGRSVPRSEIVGRTGLKLHARVVTDRCPSNLNGDRLLCWTFKESGVDGALGSTCFGDSGGPLFVLEGDRWVLAGVTTAGITCRPGDGAIDADLFRFVPWIRSHIAGNPAPGAPTTAAIGGPLDPLDNSGRFAFERRYQRFESGPPEWSNQFPLSAGLRFLRVGVIGTTSGASLRLEVGPKMGSAPACVQSGVAAMQSCEVEVPSSGDWIVKVSGTADQEFQVVGTGLTP